MSLDANIGIDLGKLNVNIPISVGLNWDNLVSADASLNGGWADNSYGLDLSAGQTIINFINIFINNGVCPAM